MPVDGANLQGANVRQVVVQADAAVQAHLARNSVPGGPDAVVRPLAHLHERVQVDKNQTIGTDLYVAQQEDNPDYNAGDALNGNGRRERDGQPRKHPTPDGATQEETTDGGDQAEEWSSLDDPRAAQERLLKGLSELSLAQAADEVFGNIDRHLLSGLLLPEGAGHAGALVAYQRQTVQVQPGPEAFRAAVLGAQKAVERYAADGRDEDREQGRKLVSLARQGVRSGSVVGRELAAFLDAALLETSRPRATGALKAVAHLAIVESAISLWRESRNVGTVQPWSLR